MGADQQAGQCQPIPAEEARPDEEHDRAFFFSHY